MKKRNLLISCFLLVAVILSVSLCACKDKKKDANKVVPATKITETTDMDEVIAPETTDLYVIDEAKAVEDAEVIEEAKPVVIANANGFDEIYNDDMSSILDIVSAIVPKGGDTKTTDDSGNIFEMIFGMIVNSGSGSQTNN